MNNKYTLEEPYVSKMRHRPFPLWASLQNNLDYNGTLQIMKFPLGYSII
jgi:hypothetical protein